MQIKGRLNEKPETMNTPEEEIRKVEEALNKVISNSGHKNAVVWLYCSRDCTRSHILDKV